MDLLLADVEQIVVTFLRESADVATIVSDRVYTDLPNQRTYPLVSVTRSGGGPSINKPMWNDIAQLTITCEAASKKAAWTLMATVASALAHSLVGAYDEGKVTNFVVNDISYQPVIESADQAGHARPRYVIESSVSTHI